MATEEIKIKQNKGFFITWAQAVMIGGGLISIGSMYMVLTYADARADKRYIRQQEVNVEINNKIEELEDWMVSMKIKEAYQQGQED